MREWKQVLEEKQCAEHVNPVVSARHALSEFLQAGQCERLWCFIDMVAVREQRSNGDET